MTEQRKVPLSKRIRQNVEAATGKSGEAPRRGVVEDVEDVRERGRAAEEGLTNALTTIATLREELALAMSERRGLIGLVRAELEGEDKVAEKVKLLPLAQQRMAENATLRAERDEARLEVKNAYNLFPPLLHAIDVALNGPAPDGVMRGYSTLPRQVEALRAALTAAQELLELPGTCVVCSAILEPREDEAPHCHDCVVTDEHEAERQDRITQLEIALAQAAPAQEGQP